MASVYGTIVSLVWALLTHKDRAAYDELFQAIRALMIENGFEIKVCTFSIDFEMAVQKSLLATFGEDCIIQFWFFFIYASRSLEKFKKSKLNVIALERVVRVEARQKARDRKAGVSSQ